MMNLVVVTSEHFKRRVFERYHTDVRVFTSQLKTGIIGSFEDNFSLYCNDFDIQIPLKKQEHRIWIAITVKHPWVLGSKMKNGNLEKLKGEKEVVIQWCFDLMSARKKLEEGEQK